MFRTEKFSDSSMPPNKDWLDCLLKHLQRANYQAAVWKQSTSCSIDAPSLVNHGWKLNQEGKISIQWMDGNCAPDALLANCNCKCKTGCATKPCSCKKALNVLTAQTVRMNLTNLLNGQPMTKFFKL